MKELLVFAPRDGVTVMVLVPKQRGEGFVRVPLGHHYNDLARLCYDEIGYDVWGLDGSLDVQTGYIAPDDRTAIIKQIAEPLSKHYGWPWREVDHDEFWAKNPLKA